MKNLNKSIFEEKLNSGKMLTISHKSQGSTCDHIILAATEMTNRACYVGSSRGRQLVKVFCQDFEHLHSKFKRVLESKIFPNIEQDEPQKYNKIEE